MSFSYPKVKSALVMSSISDGERSNGERVKSDGKRRTLFVTAAFCCSAAQNFLKTNKVLCAIQFASKNSTLLTGKAISRLVVNE